MPDDELIDSHGNEGFERRHEESEHRSSRKRWKQRLYVVSTVVILIAALVGLSFIMIKNPSPPQPSGSGFYGDHTPQPFTLPPPGPPAQPMPPR